jgi:hypothetical protein
MPCTAGAAADALQMHQGMVLSGTWAPAQDNTATRHQAHPHHASPCEAWAAAHPLLAACTPHHHLPASQGHLNTTAAGTCAATALRHTVLYKNAGNQQP